MDSKLKGKIISAIRKVTYTYEPRNKVRKRQQVAPATFMCESCDFAIYSGKKNLKEAELDKFKKVKKSKVYVDHIEPCIPIEGFGESKWDWNSYLSRMFCGEDGLQLLCKECHDIKTKKENELRKKFRRKEALNETKKD